MEHYANRIVIFVVVPIFIVKIVKNIPAPFFVDFMFLNEDISYEIIVFEEHNFENVEITKIENMAYPELCAMFAELFNGVACPTNTRTLRNRLIYKVQEMHLGGITTSDMQLLMSLIENDGTPQKQSSAAPEATSVIHYVREWKGKKYDVTEVSEKCYELDGKQYKSLSAVARAITGTRWNGKLFFGVTR